VHSTTPTNRHFRRHPEDSPLAYGIPEAAAVIGIGRTTLYAEIGAGRLPTITIGRRRLVTRDALEDYLDRCAAEPLDAA